ncbi:MAG: DoxX family protein [Armatimonadetes bacterium]|nr:DoxX family protein [Armatimonadota bacterium]MBS1702662.1 DoxX family protein [Armatimonadota bacterium]
MNNQSNRTTRVGYWILTVLFSLMMALSATMYLTSDAMVQAFRHLGFPTYFRVELALAKYAGVAALLAPVPDRVREWAYAGFGITLASAVIAHSSVDGPQAAAMPAVFLIILCASYVLRAKLAPSKSALAEG